MEPTAALLGITAAMFPGRKPVSQAWWVYLQPPERQHIAGFGEGEEMGSGREAASQRMLVGSGVGVSPPSPVGLLP